MSQRSGNVTLDLWILSGKILGEVLRQQAPSIHQRLLSYATKRRVFWGQCPRHKECLGMLRSTCCFAMQDTSSGVIWHCNLYQAAVILPSLYASPFCHSGVKRYQLLESRGQKDNLLRVLPPFSLNLRAAPAVEPAFTRFWHQNDLFMGTGTFR